ncbi:MAG: hypothetical protein F6K19_45110 [Cyanothece sp. SIO1E1]|nr:hypothetical protein [Cyanothece sp. SIO1E1]
MSLLDLTTEIPTNIDTLTRLHAWSGLTLHFLNRGITYKETNDAAGTVDLINTALLEAADRTDRLIIRAAIPINPAFRVDKSNKLWMFAENFSDAQIPTDYRTN